MMNIATFNPLFERVIQDYHQWDNVDQLLKNPNVAGTIAYLLYEKCWVDTVQWHLEDIIRDPGITPLKAVEIKRRIDASNQQRTDLVEKIDDFFVHEFQKVNAEPSARINTESPAWAIDRLSILALKIYHMREETNRADAGEDHRASTKKKLEILLIQRKDLTQAIEELLQDILAGKRLMKVYRQMKMYNDPDLNPVLYKAKS